ncbi:MAG TPA: transglycosylase domain-containing protein [Actinomycetota bacterium]|nr:transglycosylase domain-containing protein [Actinomycetota bacterium]
MTGKPTRVLMAAVAALATTAAACGPIEQLSQLPHLSKGDLKLRIRPQTSRILDGKGRVIAALHGPMNRTVVPMKDIPWAVSRAVVAIEDERFYEHDGVDPKAILRAAVENVTSGRVEEGGSTITQQYVKQAIIAPGEIAERSLKRKIDEAALARQLEKRLTKREILWRYLNTVYFGEGAYGIQAAARTYFAKPARELNLAEAALLAGIIRSPENYDPLKHMKNSRARRDVVLAKMLQLGYIGPRRYRQAKAAKITLETGKERYPAAYFVDYVQRLLKYDPRFKEVGKTPAAREQRLFQGGLRIYTTLDLERQWAAEQAVQGILPYDRDPHAALVSVDPKTGFVEAMVGGRDYFARPKEDRFAKLNLAIMGEPGLGPKSMGGRAAGTGRQAGSSFKPFALVAAIQQGIPLTKRYDAPPTIVIPGADNGGPWTVSNYEGESFGGQISLLDATIHSVNTVYAQLIVEVGAEAAVNVAKEMGIRSPLQAVASAVLGTNPVNPLDMASAYATLAAGGVYHPPVAITKIVDTTTGKVIYRDRSEPRRVLDPAVAYIVTSALEQVIQQGTGTGANIGRPAAGKTGTAQEYRDAWFAGYTPDLSTVVWVGYPEGEIEMKPYCATSLPCRPTRIPASGVTGGSWPAEIWHDFMLQALTGVPPSAFPIPASGLVTVTIDTRNGCLVSRYTPPAYRQPATFAPGTAPTTSCIEPGDITREKGGSGPSPQPSETPQPSKSPQPTPSGSPSEGGGGQGGGAGGGGQGGGPGGGGGHGNGHGHGSGR